MGKATDKGFVKKDHPMFSSGPELFSRPASSESSTNSASATAGAAPAASASPQPETEADGERAGALRVAKYKHQNKQFRKKD